MTQVPNIVINHGPVRDILPAPRLGEFRKADGEPVVAAHGRGIAAA